MKKFLNKYTLFVFGIIFLLGIWFLISALIDKNSMIFPSPIETFKLMFQLLGKSQTYGYLAFSLIRLVVGFVVSILLAFLLGLLVNDNEKLYNFFEPTIIFLKSAPTATFVFLFLVLVGGKNAPAFVVVLVTFPILYESIVSAFRSSKKSVVEAAKVDGAGKLKRLLKVQLPMGMPFITLGIVSTFGMAFKIEIMAEIITGITKGGIGTMINVSQILDPTNLTPMFAYSLMAIILVLLITLLVTLFKKKIAVVNPIKHRDMYKN